MCFSGYRTFCILFKFYGSTVGWCECNEPQHSVMLEVLLGFAELTPTYTVQLQSSHKFFTLVPMRCVLLWRSAPVRIPTQRMGTSKSRIRKIIIHLRCRCPGNGKDGLKTSRTLDLPDPFGLMRIDRRPGRIWTSGPRLR